MHLGSKNLANKLDIAVQPKETTRRAIGAISWGVSNGLWKVMARNGDKTQKVSDLAAEVGTDAGLLGTE